MNAKDIFAKLSDLELYQQRRVAEDYAEVVIFSKEVLVCSNIIQSILGEPVSPAGIEPTDEAVALAKELGGIYDEQTLFAGNIDGVKVVVMFWPWQDGEHTTVKIVCSGDNVN